MDDHTIRLVEESWERLAPEGPALAREYSSFDVPSRAIRLPSGDQTGVEDAISPVEICRSRPESTSTTQMSSSQ